MSKKTLYNILIPTILLLFSFGCSATENLPEPVEENIVSVEYDKFDNETTHQSAQARVYSGAEEWGGLVRGGNYFRHRIYIEGLIVCEGENRSCNSPEAYLLFTSLSETGWKLLKNSRANFIVNGNRNELGKVQADREVIRGDNVRERFLVPVDYSYLKEIATADKVEARLGNFELNMAENRRVVLEKLIREFES